MPDCCIEVVAGCDEFDQLSKNDAGCDEIDQLNIKADCMYDDDSSCTSVPELTIRYNSSDEEDSILMLVEEMERDEDIRDDVWDKYQTDIECHIPDPKARPQNTPITILVANSIGCCTSRKLLKVLFDSGSSKSLISRLVIPTAAVPKCLSSEDYCNTIAGKLKVTEVVTLRDI